MLERPDFTTPPRRPVCAPLQPSWMLAVRAHVAALRRVWAVRQSQVSPACYRWLTAGFGPPWQEERDA